VTAPSHNQPDIRTTSWNATTAVNSGVAELSVVEGFADPDTRRWVPNHRIKDAAGADIARR
jgi:hypothetical protein